MDIKVGESYFFTKSGNLVEVVAPAAPYRGLPMWEVRRVEGRGAGKLMDVPARSLVKSLD